MTGLITFLLLIAWVFLIIYCPRLFYGYTYTQILDVMNSEDAQEISEFTKLLGLNEENATQVATKYFCTCIATIIGCLILILITRKLLLLLENWIDRKNQLANMSVKQKMSITKSNNKQYSVDEIVDAILDEDQETISVKDKLNAKTNTNKQSTKSKQTTKQDKSSK